MVHDGAVFVRLSARARRGLLLLLSVLSVGVVLCGIAAMHAQLASVNTSSTTSMEASVTTPHNADNMAAGTEVVAATDAMQGGMGGMGAMDCMLLGMMCLFGVVALLLLVLGGRLRSLRRRRLAVRALAATVAGWLRPPAPPSLLVLSISRT